MENTLVPYSPPDNIPLLFQVYMFNVTNADAWLAGEGGVRLEVEEVGPLVYRETWWRTNVELHSDGQVVLLHLSSIEHGFQQVSYDLVKRFVPVPELSAVKEDLLITIPNIPYWAGADRMAGQVLSSISSPSPLSCLVVYYLVLCILSCVFCLVSCVLFFCVLCVVS